MAGRREAMGRERAAPCQGCRAHRGNGLSRASMVPSWHSDTDDTRLEKQPHNMVLWHWPWEHIQTQMAVGIHSAPLSQSTVPNAPVGRAWKSLHGHAAAARLGMAQQSPNRNELKKLKASLLCCCPLLCGFAPVHLLPSQNPCPSGDASLLCCFLHLQPNPVPCSPFPPALHVINIIFPTFMQSLYVTLSF